MMTEYSGYVMNIYIHIYMHSAPCWLKLLVSCRNESEVSERVSDPIFSDQTALKSDDDDDNNNDDDNNGNGDGTDSER